MVNRQLSVLCTGNQEVHAIFAGEIALQILIRPHVCLCPVGIVFEVAHKDIHTVVVFWVSFVLVKGGKFVAGNLIYNTLYLIAWPQISTQGLCLCIPEKIEKYSLHL